MPVKQADLEAARALLKQHDQERRQEAFSCNAGGMHELGYSAGVYRCFKCGSSWTKGDRKQLTD